MVRLGVISDSHQNQSCTERFLALANREGYGAVFFLGDGESEARWLRRRLQMPLYFVAGNCDIFSKEPREIVEAFEGVRIMAVHGHLYDVKWELDRLSYAAESRGARVALYGHTHNPAAEYVGPVLMMNPGALTRGCYGELQIDGDRATPYLKNLNDR